MTVTVTVVVALCCGVPESVTLKMYGVAAIAAGGVPPICPVEAFNVSHAGSVPAVNCQVYGVTPPLAVRVVEHGVPTTQFRVTADAVVSWGWIVSVKDTDAVCCGVPESATLNVSGVAVTADSGVPLTTPVAVFSVNPDGSVPEVNCQVYGSVPPVATTACE
jgi:20S proteasome alpha/beta subunit